MGTKLTLDLDALTVTSFETESEEAAKAGVAVTLVNCTTGCNTRNTCSTNLC